MKTGQKYHPLYQALSTARQDRVSFSFEEIEDLLGRPLPASARLRRDWWGNRKKASQAAAWTTAGYQMLEVDLNRQQVTFGKLARLYIIQHQGGSVAWDSELIKALRYHMGLNQAEFAEQLGVRQQTISEWETGIYAPRRATRKYLTLVAEKAGFVYTEEGEAFAGEDLPENT